jgi:hypothetical protein
MSLSSKHRSMAGSIKKAQSTEDDPSVRYDGASILESSPTKGHEGLHRGLSARQVQMIAIGGYYLLEDPVAHDHSTRSWYNWDWPVLGNVKIPCTRRPREHVNCIRHRGIYRICYSVIAR